MRRGQQPSGNPFTVWLYEEDLSRPRIARPGPNEADQAARFILDVLSSQDR